MSERLPPAISIMGPTASGKTDLALLLSRKLPVEVISVDSALIYREMNIGTAKPDASFLAELPHFLVDIRNPDESYSVAEFRQNALSLMREIVQRGNIPLLVGGTMMYFKALVDGLAEMPATDAEVRHRVSSEAERVGWPGMHARLANVDPVSAMSIHPNHSQRIQRALEVYYSSGKPLSEWQAEQVNQPLPCRLHQFALLPFDRAQLHMRIEQRFNAMLDNGFLEEVQTLRASYTLTSDMMSMRAVGYRQALAHLADETSFSEFIAQGVAATRQLAKRQLTWLRKWTDLHTFSIDFSDPKPLLPIVDHISEYLSADID